MWGPASPRFYLEGPVVELSLRAGNYPDRAPGTSTLPYGGTTVSFRCGLIYVGAEKLPVTLFCGFLCMSEHLATAGVCTPSIPQECEGGGRCSTCALFNLLPVLTLFLVQLTAALRSLADHPDARPAFLSSGVFSDLCLVLRLCSQDQDICTNVSRISRYHLTAARSWAQISAPAPAVWALSRLTVHYEFSFHTLTR